LVAGDTRPPPAGAADGLAPVAVCAEAGGAWISASALHRSTATGFGISVALTRREGVLAWERREAQAKSLMSAIVEQLARATSNAARVMNFRRPGAAPEAPLRRPRANEDTIGPGSEPPCPLFILSPVDPPSS
jgi:hypothetical protein